jgi:hypothetical protein
MVSCKGNSHVKVAYSDVLISQVHFLHEEYNDSDDWNPRPEEANIPIVDKG